MMVPYCCGASVDHKTHRDVRIVHHVARTKSCGWSARPIPQFLWLFTICFVCKNITLKLTLIDVSGRQYLNEMGKMDSAVHDGILDPTTPFSGQVADVLGLSSCIQDIGQVC